MNEQEPKYLVWTRSPKLGIGSITAPMSKVEAEDFRDVMKQSSPQEFWIEEADMSQWEVIAGTYSRVRKEPGQV